MAQEQAQVLELVIEHRVLVELHALGIHQRKTIHEISSLAVEAFLAAPFSQTPFDRYLTINPDGQSELISIHPDQVDRMNLISQRDRVTIEELMHTALVHYLENQTEFAY